MFPHYEVGARVVAIEPNSEFLEVARDVAQASRASITVRQGAGELVEAEADSFDALVLSMVLCSVDDMLTVLTEAKRVTKPGGTLRAIEHVCSARPVSAALMHAVNPVWRAINGQGCNIDRDPIPPLLAAGFTIESVEPFQLFVPGLPAFPFKTIVARS
jgi:SAM-dependent methyltransferase